jgi:hypothetical protein
MALKEYYNSHWHWRNSPQSSDQKYIPLSNWFSTKYLFKNISLFNWWPKHNTLLIKSQIAGFFSCCLIIYQPCDSSNIIRSQIASSVILVDRRTTATLSHHRQCQPHHLSVGESILAPRPARPPSIPPLRFSFAQPFARFLVIVCDFCMLLLWVAQSV